MIPGGVHKGPGKHGHTADVLAGLHVIVGIDIVDALGLLADGHDILPGQHGVVEGGDLLLPGAGAQCALYGQGGQGEQDHGGGDLCGVAVVGGGASHGGPAQIGGQPQVHHQGGQHEKGEQGGQDHVIAKL